MYRADFDLDQRRVRLILEATCLCPRWLTSTPFAVMPAIKRAVYAPSASLPLLGAVVRVGKPVLCTFPPFLF